MKQSTKLQATRFPRNITPPLLVDSDLYPYFADQTSTEFTRRGDWGVRSLNRRITFFRNNAQASWPHVAQASEIESPHPPAPSPYKFGLRVKVMASFNRPNLRGEGEYLSLIHI